MLDFIGAATTLQTSKWGSIRVESARLSPAPDGDLVAAFGSPYESERPIVRIHSECLFSEVFGDESCDCGTQLEMALKILVDSKVGLLFYLRSDGRDVGLAAKIRAHELELSGMDTYESHVALGLPPDSRSYERVGSFLSAKGVRNIQLLTNNPRKIRDVEKCGISVSPRTLTVECNSEPIRRLYETKRQKFGHAI